MLSSAPKSVPTREQFIQPYFIEIASNGAIKATCARFTTLLKKRNIYPVLEKNIQEIFAQLGKLTPGFPEQFQETALPGLIDLSINGRGVKPFLIRWIATPVYSPEGETGNWQLSGMKIYPESSRAAGSREPSRQAGDELQYQASLVKYVSDIIVTTDLQHQVIYWNKAAEKFYGIPAGQAIGQHFPEMIRYEYPYTTEEKVKKALQEESFWDGECIYVSEDGKKSYLISSIRHIKDPEDRVTGIMAVNRDITENKLAQQDRKKAEMQLRQYSEQMKNILESITDGFFVLDKDFKVTLWNHEAERITRLSSAEMLGQPIWEKLPDLVDKNTYQSFQKAFSKKMTVTLEQYNARFDRWLEMSIYPSEQGLFAYFKDVTVRKKHEVLLALEKKVLEMNSSKKASLRTILNYFLKGIQKIFPGMYCCVLTLDDERLCVKLLSAPGLPAIYAHAIDGLLIGPMAGSCGTAIYRKEKVIVSDIETDPLWHSHKDLALRFGLRACWSFPILDAKEDVLAAFAVYYTTSKSPTAVELDIIERAANLVTIIIESKSAEEELSISNERYTLATKATNDAIWDLDFHTELYFWGEGFYHQFGHKPIAKVRTRKFREMHIHPEDRERVLRNMEKFIRRKKKDLWLEEYRFKRSDGKYALVSDRGFLVFGKEGKAIRMVGSMQDITGKREMEKRLLKQELNKQKIIAQAIVDAQEKERAEIGKELHDNINQILSTTKLYLELAKNDSRERLSLISRSAENIHEAIHEIRNISRSLVPSSIGDLGLQDSIADLVESIRTTRAIHVEFYPVGKFDERISDKEKLMLFRIIQEQINNVLKHSGARNLIIELIFEESENRIELNITDDGKGFNLEKVKNKKGLGLSNIMSRADLFGGKVTIMSSPGRGCKLRVQVPVI
ncbi:MAG TPA: PAS domain S-box protein [Puia sp.]|nr:PAS domain S-box protein [Puia sp.]